MNKELIKFEVRKRSVKQVVHFTQLDNLDSILTHGLLPRDELDLNDYDYRANDQFRMDDCTNASCLSISFPKYKMFYACRMQDESTKWIGEIGDVHKFISCLEIKTK